jgi:hypothetical protein
VLGYVLEFKSKMARHSGSRRSPHKTAVNKHRYYVDAVFIGALILFSFFYFYGQRANFIDLSDEGFLAYGAASVLDGRIPNTDFVSLQPPLSFYTTAGVFKLMGTSLQSMRSLGFAIHLCVIALTFLICRTFAKPIVAFTATLPAVFIGIPFFSFVPFAVWHGVVFSLAAVFFFLTYLSKQKFCLLFLSGLMTALTILSRHDQGFYSALATVLCLLIIFFKKDSPGRASALKIFGCWTGGVLLLIVPFVLWSLFIGSAHSMLKQLVLFPFATYGQTSSIAMPKFDLSRDLAQNIFVCFFYLTPLVALSTVLACIIRSFRKMAADFPTKCFFVSTTALLFYMQVLTRSDLNHLIITLPPFFILMGFLLGEGVRFAAGTFREKMPSLIGSTENVTTYILCGVYVLFFLAIFSFYKDRLVNPVPNNFAKLSLSRGGVFVDANTCHSIETIVSVIQSHTRENQPILCLPYQPMIYFLAGRRNPTRWNYLWPGDQSEADHLELINEARKDAPGLVLLFDRESFRAYASSIMNYVESNYRLSAEGGGVSLYLPASSRDQ